MIFKSLDFWNKAFIKGWRAGAKISTPAFWESKNATVIQKSSRKTISKNDFWFGCGGRKNHFLKSSHNKL